MNKMGLPNEISLVCENCDCFNFDEGVIKEGKIYCQRCWELYKKAEEKQ